ncbi:hypothetical protein [Paenibacillus guangzhouensis]|nr:hypothetical protein [Paenibacillus guangzhouensis]
MFRNAIKGASMLLLVITLMLSMPSVVGAVGKGAQGADVYVIQGML